MKHRQGFTLIELMIVITIIAVIAAIALPNLMRSRLQANEASAIGSCRTIVSGQISYHSVKNTYGTFEELISKTPPWIDGTWTDGYQRYGYNFEMPDVESTSFVLYAEPVEHNMTGTRFFRADHTGAIRFNFEQRASATDTPIPDPAPS